MKLKVLAGLGSLAAVTLIPTLAMAQDVNVQSDREVNSGLSGSGQQTGTTVTGQPAKPLPPPQSDHDPAPPVPAPGVPDNGVTEQAGVGGTQAYARAGVLELGGSAGFARASDFTQVNVSPSVGWFFMDNLQLSGIVGINYINASGNSSTLMTYLAEPSYHLPFSDKVFGFLGVGAGLAYAKGAGAGFALAPRLGINVLVGRSGILTPAFQMVYNTTETIPTANGTAVAINTTYGANIGYTVMW